jgi:hypothetical protein
MPLASRRFKLGFCRAQLRYEHGIFLAVNKRQNSIPLNHQLDLESRTKGFILGKRK